MNQYCPETSDLRLVQNIVTLGSLSAAAQRMHISQPALSRRLSRLEDQLGQQVFQRLGKKLIPTEAGRALLETAAIILPQLEQTAQRLATLASGKAGQLRISMECVTCYYWLPAIARQFQSTHENVQIEIVNATGATPIQMLNRGEIDLAIHTGTEKYPGVLSEALFADEFMAVMPARHPLADREYLEPQDFRDEHLVLYNPEASAAVERVFETCGR